MKRFSFSTFYVDDSNREAFETCRAVSELRTIEPQPVLLLGDDGCGKTHLLYSIVNHVRASSARAGLAYVTAREFPDEVRRLTEDPSPLERAPSAILLVDQLENFTNRARDLASVVALFLGGGHQVVLASSVHPARLRHLPENLRSIVAAGRIVPIKPRGAAKTAANRDSEFTPLTEDLLVKQQEEIRSLREQLARAKNAEASMAERIRALQEERDRTEAVVQPFESDEVARAQRKADLDAVRQRIAQLEKQIEENAPLQAEREKLERLKDEHQHVLADRERLAAECAQLSAQLEQARVAEDESARLRNELTQVTSERDAARETVARVEERALALLQRMESYRKAHAQTEEEQQERLNQLERRLAEVRLNSADQGRVAEAEERMAEIMDQMDALRRKAENDRTEFETQVATAKMETRQAIAARDRAIEKLDQLTAQHAQLEIEFDSVRTQLDAQTREMEALRHEAAAQVAAANAQAGEIERKYSELLSSFDLARQTGHVVGLGLESLRRQIVENSNAIAQLASRLTDSLEQDRREAAERGNGFPQDETTAPKDTGSAQTMQAPPEESSATPPATRNGLDLELMELFDESPPRTSPAGDSTSSISDTIHALTEDTGRIGHSS